MTANPPRLQCTFQCNSERCNTITVVPAFATSCTAAWEIAHYTDDDRVPAISTQPYSVMLPVDMSKFTVLGSDCVKSPAQSSRFLHNMRRLQQQNLCHVMIPQVLRRGAGRSWGYRDAMCPCRRFSAGRVALQAPRFRPLSHRNTQDRAHCQACNERNQYDLLPP